MTMLSRDDSSADCQRRFASKRDLWLVIVMWGAALGLVYSSIDVAGSATPATFKALFLLVSISAAALILWVLYGTSYVLTDEALLIRCGPFRHRVLLTTIQEVAPSRKPTSSPACSLDRLHIRYQGSRLGVLISPSDKPSFLQELSSRDSNLSLRDDRIVRGA